MVRVPSNTDATLSQARFSGHTARLAGESLLLMGIIVSRERARQNV